jgi:hypothetical protein
VSPSGYWPTTAKTDRPDCLGFGMISTCQTSGTRCQPGQLRHTPSCPQGSAYVAQPPSSALGAEGVVLGRLRRLRALLDEGHEGVERHHRGVTEVLECRGVGHLMGKQAVASSCCRQPLHDLVPEFGILGFQLQSTPTFHGHAHGDLGSKRGGCTCTPSECYRWPWMYFQMQPLWHNQVQL